MKLTPMEMLSLMMTLVVTQFEGTYDKGGVPYALHCFKVMHYLHTDDPELMCIALGHDLIEDRGKYVTYAMLREMGFSERVIEGIRCLTKIPGESYEEYQVKVMSNWDAIRVKKCDLRHNSDIRRLKGVTEKDILRTTKYHKFYILLDALEGPVKSEGLLS